MNTEPTVTGRDEFETMTCVVPVLDSENGVMRARGTAFFVSECNSVLDSPLWMRRYGPLNLRAWSPWRRTRFESDRVAT
jgi:hypothetical protein